MCQCSTLHRPVDVQGRQGVKEASLRGDVRIPFNTALTLWTIRTLHTTPAGGGARGVLLAAAPPAAGRLLLVSVLVLLLVLVLVLVLV